MSFELNEQYTPSKNAKWDPKFKIKPQSHETFSSSLDEEQMAFKAQS